MDSGHVKQVATFEKLLGFCNAHGAMFNPSKAAIKPTALSNLLTSAQHSIEAVKTMRTEYDNAVNNRNQAFDELPKFMTRIVNALASTEASPATVKEAYIFSNRMRPQPKLRPAIPSGNANAESEPASTRSISQLDFDSKTDNFEALVKVVSLEPFYKPNEADLKVASLREKAASLNSMNTVVINTQVALSNARADRNKLLYETNGIHDSSKAIKHYVKGVFGFQSTAYRQISGLAFKDQNIA